MGVPSLGNQIVCIVQFVVLMTMLGPILGLCSTSGVCIIPASQYNAYFGVNGIANTTSANFQNNLVSPLVQQANTTSGFGASSNLQNFSGLAFVYGAMGLAWKSFTNFPTMLFLIFTSLGTSVAFIPFAIISIASIGILAYILIGDFMIVLGMWMKTDPINLGGS